MVRGADPTENRSLRLFMFQKPVVEVLVFVHGAEVRIGEFFGGGEFPFGFSFEDRGRGRGVPDPYRACRSCGTREGRASAATIGRWENSFSGRRRSRRAGLAVR